MALDSFWDSEEGREYRDGWRKLTTARGGVEARPRAKCARGAQRERDLIMTAAGVQAGGLLELDGHGVANNMVGRLM
jgi:hypothetical protein